MRDFICGYKSLLSCAGEAIGFAFVALVILVLFCYWLAEVIKQARCRHDGGVSETRACDAICRKCGRNLGFIGTWRNNNKGAS